MFSTRHHRGPLRSDLALLVSAGILVGLTIAPRAASADSIHEKRRQAANIAKIRELEQAVLTDKGYPDFCLKTKQGACSTSAVRSLTSYFYASKG